MFEKVLIVDDFASVNRGVSDLVKSLGISTVDISLYCDDAYLKIRKAYEIEKKPYDLVITDLSFKEDHRECKLKNGQGLIQELQNKYPDLPVIVYSQEDNFQKIRELIQDNGAKAYVCKSRVSEKELETAINYVFKNEIYLSKNIEQALNKNSNEQLSAYEKEVAKQLSNGLSQPEMSTYFRTYNISPSSLSSIEKCINRLKDQYNANNAVHLIAVLKDKTLI